MSADVPLTLSVADFVVRRDPETDRQARLTIVDRLGTDCRDVLEMLGLLEVKA